jgi:8-oxo-dGTP pyrophosphatase MutT (NUDIX family)/GNAT superfamily N-acetyltransferase
MTVHAFDSACGCAVCDADERLDPTGTADIRAAFRSELARRWRALRAALAADGPRLLGVPTSAPTDQAAPVRGWLGAALARFIVGDGRWTSEFIDRAARRAWATGAAIPAIATLYGVVTAELQGICDATLQQAGRDASDLILSGAKTPAILKAIDGRIRAVGEQRSAQMADWMVVKAYNVSVISRLEAAGETHVAVAPEFVRGSTKTLDAIFDATSEKAAGVMFVAPGERALFLHRTDGEGWAWPGGGVEEHETEQNAAHREALEEVGHAPDGERRLIHVGVYPGLTFSTFRQDVDGEFEPHLNDEHDDWTWAPLDNPPSPLHPGVAETLTQIKGKTIDALMDAARKTAQHRHPVTGKFVSKTVATREWGRNRKTGRFGKAPPVHKRRSKAAIERLKPLGEVDVLTAEDDRVCKTCLKISNNGPYTIKRAINLIPAHVNCRCCFVPVGTYTEEIHPKDGFDPNEPRDDAGRWTGGAISITNETTGSSLEIKPYGVGEVMIGEVKTSPEHRHEGGAHALMAKTEEFLDRNRLAARLVALPKDENDEHLDLRHFYAAHGFAPANDPRRPWLMKRSPRRAQAAE